jgi:hypothetical protein
MHQRPFKPDKYKFSRRRRSINFAEGHCGPPRGRFKILSQESRSRWGRRG